MNVYQILAENIVSMRRAGGISQNHLAAQLGVSPQAVSKWERAICCPDIALLPAIAEIFGKNIDDLFKEKTK